LLDSLLQETIKIIVIDPVPPLQDYPVSFSNKHRGHVVQ